MINQRKVTVKLLCFFMYFFSIFLAVQYAQANEGNTTPEFAKDELLIKFKSDVSAEGKQTCAQQYNLEITEEYSQVGVSLCKIKYDTDVISACAGLHLDSRVEFVEPNYIVNIDVKPNDPSFSSLWGLHNTGQTGGTADADIDAPEAWDITTGDSGVVVAVIDTGVNYNHPDLQANMWKNPGEIPGNGVDDDGNGHIDDVFGIDAFNNDSDPLDDNSHGSHVAGTIGATGDNGLGVVGVNWKVKIMALKFLSAGGSGFTSGAIKCLDYVKLMKNTFGINIVVSNNSWGGGGFSASLKSAIEAAGTLFVAAAGNSGRNNDSVPHYPSSYTSEEVLSVASTDHNDNKSSFSNYGLTSVDLGAPGSSILSTVLGNSYGFKSGTSMATPHVAGVAALILAVKPGLTTSGLKSLIMASTDPIPALNGRTVTGGRLNAHKAVSGPTGNATVSGQVTDIVTGNPIKRARVIVKNKITKERTIVKADVNGDYVVNVPPALKYKLIVRKRGYVAHKENLGELKDGDNLIRDVQLAVPVPDRTVHNLNQEGR